MDKSRGFSQEPNHLKVARWNILTCGSFAKAPSEPTVGSISVGGLWALKTYVNERNASSSAFKQGTRRR